MLEGADRRQGEDSLLLPWSTPLLAPRRGSGLLLVGESEGAGDVWASAAASNCAAVLCASSGVGESKGVAGRLAGM
eukprot:1161079-Pelagomonas_calceolata.AAC.3